MAHPYEGAWADAVRAGVAPPWAASLKGRLLGPPAQYLGAWAVNLVARLGLSGGAASPISAYVANQGSSTVSQYSRDTTTGALTAMSPATIATGASPRSVAVSADGKSAYVANYSSNTVSQYSRDTTTGALTAMSPATIAAGVGPISVTTA